MSTHSIKSAQENDANRRLSRSSSDRIIYVDDASYEFCHEPSTDYCQLSDNCRALYRSDDRVQFYSPCPDTTVFHLDDHPAHCPSALNDESRRNGPGRSKTGESRHAKNVSEINQCSSRRSSVQSGRSRANSCSRPTPLGRRQLGHQTFRSMRNARTVRWRSRLVAISARTGLSRRPIER